MLRVSLLWTNAETVASVCARNSTQRSLPFLTLKLLDWFADITTAELADVCSEKSLSALIAFEMTGIIRQRTKVRSSTIAVIKATMFAVVP